MVYIKLNGLEYSKNGEYYYSVNKWGVGGSLSLDDLSGITWFGKQIMSHGKLWFRYRKRPLAS